MGGGWGADEACLRGRGGPMLRGSVDALFGFLAQNDAEWWSRELLGWTWRRF